MEASPPEPIDDLAGVVSAFNSHSLSTRDRSNIALTWTAPDNNGEGIQRYAVFAYDIQTGDWVNVETYIPATKTYYTHQNLSSLVERPDGYTYQVKSMNTDGWSPPSNIVQVFTLPCPHATGEYTYSQYYNGNLIPDTVPPTVNVPGYMSVYATSSSGGSFMFDVSATDGIAICPSDPTCSHAPGSFFQVGTTTVTCTASDAAGNVGTESFVISVILDTTSPTVNVPSDMTVYATSSSGGYFPFDVSATDDVTLSYNLTGPTCSHAPGSFFQVGTTTVTCTASDAAGNVGTESFVISVILDTTSPTVNVPSDMTVYVTTGAASGGYFPFDVSATDDIGVVSGPTCSHTSGSFFQVGTTTVTCTASDAVGNIGTESFTITVIYTDATLPTVNVPSDMTVYATSSSGDYVMFEVSVTDDVSVVSGPTCSHAPGSFFEVGTTTVTCTATDSSGNVGTDGFTITVTYTAPEPEAPPAPTPTPTPTPTPPTESSTTIPAWIKNNAGWWASGMISDTQFLQGIEYLINEGIIVVPPTTESGTASSTAVPSWVKNNAGWWVDGIIDDNTFVSGIQYLIQIGLIQVG